MSFGFREKFEQDLEEEPPPARPSPPSRALQENERQREPQKRRTTYYAKREFEDENVNLNPNRRRTSLPQGLPSSLPPGFPTSNRGAHNSGNTSGNLSNIPLNSLPLCVATPVPHDGDTDNIKSIEAQKKKKRRDRIILLCLVLALVLIAGLGTLVALQMRSPPDSNNINGATGNSDGQSREGKINEDSESGNSDSGNSDSEETIEISVLVDPEETLIPTNPPTPNPSFRSSASPSSNLTPFVTAAVFDGRGEDSTDDIQPNEPINNNGMNENDEITFYFGEDDFGWAAFDDDTMTSAPTANPTVATCEDKTTPDGEWKDAEGDGCDWYKNLHGTSNCKGPNCCDEYGFESYDRGRLKNFDMTASNACCVCGGGWVSSSPSEIPSAEPSMVPTTPPTKNPTKMPTKNPTAEPSNVPTQSPSVTLTTSPSFVSSREPTNLPSKAPTQQPSLNPTKLPTLEPTNMPSKDPTRHPSPNPTKLPTFEPTSMPTKAPTLHPSPNPTKLPTLEPTIIPTAKPSVRASEFSSTAPTRRSPEITSKPTTSPTITPTSTPCKIWCAKNTNLWERKCNWKFSCKGCSDCATSPNNGASGQQASIPSFGTWNDNPGMGNGNPGSGGSIPDTGSGNNSSTGNGVTKVWNSMFGN
eukprot:CAMPEP_0195511696 /NCGR_PEP_ID=MMETSP0794_2-20130614/3931_1 /TAXON_ID=515487 /ORGANISM="Stephanopyxis turris, Strain CCMP 815" /LENGTH=641 /DNA_ID=CAMNT_0040639349 /DNA_START=74 /DNA_END=1999 /DNA_ORIENTATION=-